MYMQYFQVTLVLVCKMHLFVSTWDSFCGFSMLLLSMLLVAWICSFTWAATLKARVLKEVWNIAAVFPVEKNLAGGGGGNDNGSNGSSNSSFSGEIVLEENFLGICSRELLARGCELLKRTRTGILPEIYIFVLFFLVCLNQIFEPFDGFTEGKGALFKLSFLHMNIFFLKFSHYCPTTK